MENKVSAIVAAYNEEKNIGMVLDILENSAIVSEIIVIDDYSKDRTREIAKMYKKVKYLRNERNRGKAYSMNRGVMKAKEKLLFFCDADVIGLEDNMIRKAVSSINGKDMFILGRDRILYRLLVPLGLKIGFIMLSGERVVRKSLWVKIPNFYKYRFRVETGMNYYSKFFGKGYDVGIFNTRQIPKEKNTIWQRVLG